MHVNTNTTSLLPGDTRQLKRIVPCSYLVPSHSGTVIQL